MRKILYISLPFILTLFLTEVLLRFTPYKALINKSMISLERDPSKQFYLADPDLGFTIQPNKASSIRTFPHDGISYVPHSNEIGCYDNPLNEIELDSAGLAIGDSFTFGTHELGNGWTSKLENLSNNRILKCGVDSYGTKQELLWTKRILSKLKAKPKFIILQYYIGNDMFDDYLHPAVISMFGNKISRFDLSLTNFSSGETFPRSENQILDLLKKEISSKPSIFAKRSIIISLFEGILSEKGLASIQIPTITSSSHSPSFLTFDKNNRSWLNHAWDIHLQGLLDFKKLCDSNNIPIFVLVIPTNDQVYPFLIPENEMNDTDILQPNRIVTEFLAKNNISYIDILDSFRKWANQEKRKMLDPKKDFYNKVDGHFSLIGEEYTGLLVAQYLASQNIFDHSVDKLREINIKLETFESRLNSFKPKLLKSETPEIVSYGPQAIELKTSYQNNKIAFWLKLKEIKNTYIVDTVINKYSPIFDTKSSILTFEVPLSDIKSERTLELSIYDRVTGLSSSKISIPIFN